MMDIQVRYEDRVRVRPGIFIGNLSDGSGLARMLTEVVAFNLMDELRGESSAIVVTLGSGGAIGVTHHLVGVADPAELFKIVERDLVDPYRNRSEVTYSNAVPCVGIAIVRALSSRFEVEASRLVEGYSVAAESGHAVPRGANSGRSGCLLRFTFVPDEGIFGAGRIQMETIAATCRKMRVVRPTSLSFIADRQCVAFALTPMTPEDLRAALEEETERALSFRRQFLAEMGPLLREVGDEDDCDT